MAAGGRVRANHAAIRKLPMRRSMACPSGSFPRMASDPTDRRFAHFCRTGDPDALGDVFDATAGRLMRVAL